MIRTDNMSLSLLSWWPGKETISALVNRAAGLFIWPSTAFRFIDGHDPRKQLNILLANDASANAESAFDALYMTALRSTGWWVDEDFRMDFCSVVGVIITARNPISDRSIDASIGIYRPPKGFPFAEWVKNNIFPSNNSNAPASEPSVRASDKWSSSSACFVVNGGPCKKKFAGKSHGSECSVRSFQNR